MVLQKSQLARGHLLGNYMNCNLNIQIFCVKLEVSMLLLFTEEWDLGKLWFMLFNLLFSFTVQGHS